MATPKGRYRFLRLPFVPKTAPEFHLQVMSDLFGDIPEIIIYFDDFLVVGETVEELECNLRKVFGRCRETNLNRVVAKIRD